MNPLDPFRPPPGLRSGFLQSVLASKRPAARIWRRAGIDLDALSTVQTLRCEDEHGAPVIMTGHYTPQPQARALVVLLHGWEGSHRSSYLYGVAAALHQAGHALFRLNLRDHGDTHHLNREMFHSARLREVLSALQQLQQTHADLPLVVLGFSLGGNFTLRVGLQGPAHGVHPRLCAAVSPVMTPAATLAAIDAGPALIHRYFIDKWHQTLQRKAAAWPGEYDFRRHYRIRSFVEITRAFVEDYTDYPTMESYLAAYTLTPAQLVASPTPLAILTAEDDSVIPAADFDGLGTEGAVRDFQRTRHGGHCGYVDRYSLHSWSERWAVAQVSQALG